MIPARFSSLGTLNRDVPASIPHSHSLSFSCYSLTLPLSPRLVQTVPFSASFSNPFCFISTTNRAAKPATAILINNTGP